MFDFNAAIKEAAEDTTNALGLIILGSSGSGKSTAIGSFPVKTLFLYTSSEAHGAAAAKSSGKNVVPVSIDVAKGEMLSADKAYDRLLSILNDVEGIKEGKFGAVALDGATEIETLIRSTTRWKIACQTKGGEHNAFAEGPATLLLFRPIIDALKNLQRKLKVHYAVSCILDVMEIGDDGSILKSKPRLQTYAVAEGIIQLFADVVAVGRMTNGQDVAHRFQLMAGVSRESKDARGNVKKSINFSPRLSGIRLEKLPDTLPADITELIKFKESK
jgi:hypothetical protein